MKFPRIRVSGGPRDRGRQYGDLAREQVRLSIDAYARVFELEAGWDWERVRAEVAPFRTPIANHDLRMVEEMEGIAEGAGVDPLDVLAINARTEIMFSATARQAGHGDDRPSALPLECSSLAVLPARGPQGRLLVAQTWDWLLHARDTVVVLEAEPDDGPNYVTVVEAGLLAKAGLNANGLGLVTNALVCTDDAGKPGVPYHVLLRSVLDARSGYDAIGALVRSERSASANYLIGIDGVALDIETAPGDGTRVFLGYPNDDVLLHTNHFRWTQGQVRDLSITAMPDSPLRLARLEQLIHPRVGVLDVAAVQAILADGCMAPHAICAQPDPSVDPALQWATIFGVVIEPSTRTLWLSAGSESPQEFVELDYRDFLGEPQVAPLPG